MLSKLTYVSAVRKQVVDLAMNTTNILDNAMAFSMAGLMEQMAGICCH
jgi:hypothetical protein